MTRCNRFTPEQIAALNDRELKGITAWRIRRHITHCHTCAQELAELRALNMLLVSADVVPEMRQRNIAVKTKGNPLYQRHVLVSGFLGASIVSAAIGGIIFLGAGSPGSPRIAFADVERSMAEVKTARWREIRFDYDDLTGKERRHTVQEETVRMYPPARTTRTVTSVAKDTLNGLGYTGRSVSDAESVLWYVPETKEAVFRTHGSGKIRKVADGVYALLPGRNAAKWEQNWRQMMLKYSFSAPTAYQEKDDVWTTENTMLDGQSVVLFQRRELSGRPKAPYVTNTVYSIWVDLRTRRVIQNEIRQTMADTGKLRMLVREERYRYNMPLQDSDFSLEIPANVRIVTRPYSEGIK